MALRYINLINNISRF